MYLEKIVRISNVIYGDDESSIYSAKNGSMMLI